MFRKCVGGSGWRAERVGDWGNGGRDVCCMRALSPGAESQRLFDVEIGQFESVSFNFSQVTGTPLVYHTFLKEIKLIWLPFYSLTFLWPLSEISYPAFFPLLFSFLFALVDL